MPQTVHYEIFPAHPGAHLFRVTLTVRRPDPDGQKLSLPSWIPGSYLIREFARHIVELRASSGGQGVAVEKLDKHTWQCAPCDGPLSVSYEVYAWDLSVRAAYLDTRRGYFNGPSVFLRVHGQEALPATLDVRPPPGREFGAWRVATSLPRAGAAAWGFGLYRAADYDELLDHPVEMGDFTLASFEACGVPHHLVLSGRHHADTERLCRDLRSVCEAQIRFFGEPAPMQHYLFLVAVVGDGYGGLEHRASTSLICSRGDLPLPGKPETGEDYRRFLGLCSHEYFHAWNVKRIKPLAFAPYDLGRENYTRLLWAFEGITSYYDDLFLLRTGLISPADYLELLAQNMTRVLRGNGRLKQSVADSSFDAWIKFYRADENAPNALVSYYAKGAMIALALDLTLRRDSEGRYSLDDVMRALWQRYGQSGEGVPEDGVERMAAEVSDLDLRAFFERALRETGDLPLPELLAAFGVEMTLRPAESGQDKGGKPAGKSGDELARRPALGIRLDNGDSSLANVLDGGPAQQAGLAAGDVLVAVDGLRVANGNLDRLLAPLRPGMEVTIHAFRRDELLEFHPVLAVPPADTCVLALTESVDADRVSNRRAWLGA
ncbi:MAG: M61 family metallopeptidase [Burkholderiales bacterium]